MLKQMFAVAAVVAIAGGTVGNSFAYTADELSGAQELAANGYINAGSSAADFGLDNTITRKEIMKIVLNLSGKTVVDTCNGDFGDVTDDWGCKYIEAGLVNGFIAANANFRPDDSISKAEAMKLILGARGISKAYNTSDWQADWMNTAYDNSLIDIPYTDHNTSATRGWIFAIGAADQADRVESESIDDIFEGLLDDETTSIIESASQTTGYLDYDASLLGQNEDTVLFFHAEWCPSCRSAETAIEATGVDDFLLLKVDYDNSADLRTKYGITTQHSFVQVDADGELITKWVGGNSVDSIQTKIQ